MRELALFAGIGGGILGGSLVGFTTICAVEIDAYCRNVLVKRQNDGVLPAFPIWDDVRTFDGRRYRGLADIVSGGFP
jgi:DNA (cytosine-5)-methyltransferase 1